MKYSTNDRPRRSSAPRASASVEVNPARRLAFDSLLRIHSGGKYSNLEVDSAIRRSNLSKQDSALYTVLVYGVLERAITLDHIIAGLASRPASSIDNEARCALRIGIYQLLYLNKIPAHAAVSESVELAPKNAAGFVNAILRSFIRQDLKYQLPPEETLAYYSVKYSLPAPIIDLWSSMYGKETAISLAEYTVRRPRLCLRINTLASNIEDVERELSEKNIASRRSSLADDILIVERSGGIPDCRNYFVQDESSRVAVKILDAKPGMTVIDTCAAPGGKSLSTALDMQNSGTLYSFDLHENKLGLISSSAARLGIDIIKTARRDAAFPDSTLIGKADRVICDAPCSGLGVISKKPEIKYKDPSGFLRLPELQYKLLSASAAYCKNGGLLVYSTCTLNRSENEGVAEKFAKEHPEFSPHEFSIGESIRSDRGMYTFMPHKDGCDGFFVAAFVKNDA